MDSRVIDNIVESLVAGDLDADDFMRAVQQGIEAHETSLYRHQSGCLRSPDPRA